MAQEHVLVLVMLMGIIVSVELVRNVAPISIVKIMLAIYAQKMIIVLRLL